MREELGISIERPSRPELARIITSGFDLRIWRIDTWTGELANQPGGEHDELRWFQAAEIPTLELPIKGTCRSSRDWSRATSVPAPRI